jgi:hypothetical protein
MPVTIYEPVQIDRKLIVGTDHVWVLRRIDDKGTPVVPDSVKAQIRDPANSELWINCSAAIDQINGWIFIYILQIDTADKIWRTRYEGEWILDVLIDGFKYRWVYGIVTVIERGTV